MIPSCAVRECTIVSFPADTYPIYRPANQFLEGVKGVSRIWRESGYVNARIGNGTTEVEPEEGRIAYPNSAFGRETQ